MSSILYISYTGLLDPLGESQVFQYLRGLAQTHRITLLTFEKPTNLADRTRLDAMQAKCAEAGIDWHRRIWHNRPSLAATVWDVVVGARQAIALARTVGAQVVHCRSYVGSLIGLMVKRATGARLIFDMRGFWADERADAGQWSRSGPVYNAIKRIERILFTNADHVVSLTRAGVREFERFDYLRGRHVASSVVPTCTDLTLFRPAKPASRPFTLGYIGSVGTWYLFDQVSEAVARLFKRDPDSRFLVVNHGGHDTIRAELGRADVDLSRVEIRSCSYHEVGEQAGRMDAGIFFIMPAWSKRASCPTRMGEFLASGLPCLANEGVGDVAEDLAATNTGIALPIDAEGRVDMTDIDDTLDRFLRLASAPDTRARCRKAAEGMFSLAAGVAEYDRIYRRLAPAIGPAESAAAGGISAKPVNASPRQ